MAEFIYTLSKARKAHNDKVVLDDVTLAFLPGAKIGVVGPNGAGKSSLLRIMSGKDDVSNGEAMLAPGATVGILEQEPKLSDDKNVWFMFKLNWGKNIFDYELIYPKFISLVVYFY